VKWLWRTARSWLERSDLTVTPVPAKARSRRPELIAMLEADGDGHLVNQTVSTLGFIGRPS
jgi:hypothetical protein